MAIVENGASSRKAPEIIAERAEFRTDGLEAFCVVDDMMYAWDNLSPFFVKTNPRIGYGLEKRHVEKIIELLNSNKGTTF